VGGGICGHKIAGGGVVIRAVRDWLVEPAVRKLDPDAPDLTVAHRAVLRSKPMLRRLFERFYRECRQADERWFGDCAGLRIEIGSGSSFFKELYPDVLSSDIKALPFVDLVARAEALPVADDSVRALYAINVFHHLPQPRLFFRELLRVLHPGGGAVMIEPYYGPVARGLFRNLHAAERFDPGVPDWETTAASGPMSNANQALSYVVFVRDRRRFEQEFPQLELVLDRPHTHLLYLLSGGVNFRQLAPDWSAPAVEWVERALGPLDRWLAIQHTVVLRKKRAR
jgi:SAM-dependent methyltransferase